MESGLSHLLCVVTKSLLLKISNIGNSRVNGSILPRHLVTTRRFTETFDILVQIKTMTDRSGKVAPCNMKCLSSMIILNFSSSNSVS